MDEEKDEEKEKESDKWQYANCWTTVYSKLFDRVTKAADTVDAVHGAG
jgi:hypothetical protein